MTVRDLGDDDYDVVIVGGGPAGLSAGVRCANEGVKTLLIERSPILTPRICWLAEAREGIEKLRKIGVEVKDIAVDYMDTFRLITRNSKGNKAEGAISAKGYNLLGEKDVACYCVDNQDVERALLNLTDKLGIKDKNGVVGAERKDGIVELKLANGETIKTKILIDASGPLREPSRMLGKEWNPRYMWTAYGFVVRGANIKERLMGGEHTTLCDWWPTLNHGEIGCLWIDPHGDDGAYVFIGTSTILDKRNPFTYGYPPFGLNAKEHAKAYLENVRNSYLNMPEYKDIFKEAKIERDVWGLYTGEWETKPYDSNLLMAGVSAGHGTYWLGAHMQSIIYGWDAGSVAVESIGNDDYSGNFLKKYYGLLKKDCIYNMGLYGYASQLCTRFPWLIGSTMCDMMNYLSDKSWGPPLIHTTAVGKFKFSDYAKVTPSLIPRALKRLSEEVIK